MEKAVKISRALAITFVAAWFLFGGISHFTNAEFFVAIMPPYLPYHLELVWISGVLEVIGAIALVVPRTRVEAGIGLILLTIAVTPANIHMAMNPELFPDADVTGLYGRLVFQVIFLWIIWFSMGGARAARRAGKDVQPNVRL